MNEELVAGLRTALEHGENLETAIISYVNAGYAEADVRGAAQRITQGATSALAAPAVTQPSAPPRAVAPAPLVAKPYQTPLPVASPQPVPQNQKRALSGPLANVPLATPIVARPVTQAPQTLRQSAPQSFIAPKPTVRALPSFSVSPSRNSSKTIILVSASLLLLALVILGIVFSSQIIAFIDSLFV